MNVMMRSGNILNQRHARRLMSTNAPKPSWRNFSEVLLDNKENAKAGAHLTAIFFGVSGGLSICGHMIDECRSYESVIAAINEKLIHQKEMRLQDQQFSDWQLKIEKEMRLQDQQFSDVKLKIEKEMRLEDQQIANEKLKLSDEKLKNAERRLQKGY